ncbi:hypothetical protein [Paenibacillus odorifer]|uniref:hypothetical protein n=1 Tax=Paenibacillus odorifer TaxID=189426 RepID=UPI0020C049E4|nr:hypothetical protein [Paenibacillus odorifer]
MKADTKICNRCDQLLSYSSFYNQCNTKDKKSNYCKDCHKDYYRKRTERLKRDDPAKYLLVKSCYAAFERGKPTYNRDGYENIGCSFDNARSFLEALWNDEIFRNEWIAQTDIYVANNNIYKYRPTLDRINPELGYEEGNIRMLPQHINVSRGKVA